MYKLLDNNILDDVDYSPLEDVVSRVFPNGSFSSTELLNAVFVEDNAYMCLLSRTPEYRVWLFLYQVLENEWICSISKESDTESELFRTRVRVDPMGDLDKAFIPYRLVMKAIKGVTDVAI